MPPNGEGKARGVALRRMYARRQALVFLAVSAACAIATLAMRNLYDDEISSLPIITGDARSIIRFANSSDVHPPGMYLLAHVAHILLPSFRWMNLFPLAVLYGGLCVFVLAVSPLFRNGWTRAWFLMLATLHPQLLLWGTGFRWYSWWTGLALIALMVGLQPREVRPVLSVSRACAVGAMLGALFYINYVTLLFAACLGAATIFRYRRAGARWLRPMGIAAAVFVTLAAPGARRMLETYAENGSYQRMGIVESMARLLAATLASEAYLPWKPMAIAVAVVLALLLAGWAWRLRKQDVGWVSLKPGLQAIVLFGGLFFLCVGLSGLGGKPRTGLLLAPLLAVAVGCAARVLPVRLHQAGLLLMALWSAGGIDHMLTRTGLSKSMMIDRPEQVLHLIHATSADGCAVVVTYDAALSYTLLYPQAPRRTVLSPFPPANGTGKAWNSNDCARTRLYVVYSYVGGGDAAFAAGIKRELDSAAQLIEGPTTTAHLSHDPDAEGRRAIHQLPVIGGQNVDAARLPDYRYTVVAGSFHAAAIPKLRSRLPDFCAEPCPVASRP